MKPVPGRGNVVTRIQNVPQLSQNGVANYSQVLEELASIWQDIQKDPVWWDDYHRVLVTTESEPTLSGLYGKGIARWGRTTLGLLRTVRQGERLSRWSGPLKEVGPLPRDGVLIPIRHGLLLASARERRILKVDDGKRRPTLKEEIQRSAEAYELARRAGVERHIPALLDHGTTQDGTLWMLKEFAPNTRPFLCRRNVGLFESWFRNEWRYWLRKEILPTMQRFYDASGVELRDADEMIADEHKRLKHHDAPQPLWNMLQLTQETCPLRKSVMVPRALTHGDLTPMHVHRDEHSWRLIDWDKAKRSEIFKEVFFRHTLVNFNRQPHVERAYRQAFWSWLRGDTDFSSLPRGLRADIELFLDWQSSWLGIPADEQALRYQALVIVLRDTHTEIIRHEAGPLVENPSVLDDLQKQPVLLRNTLYRMKMLGVFDGA